MKALNSDFSYASANADGTWTALIRFSPGIEGLFGFTREVVTLYTPYADLQPRLYEHLPAYRSQLAAGRSAEDHLYFVWSSDIQAAKKLDNWSPTGAHLAIALPRVTDPREAAGIIRNSLLDRLAKRNLYDETLPVTGRDFFGRRQILQQLSEELRQGNVCGIYGLRKTGKTSLIKELGQRFQEGHQQTRLFILRDLETLPSDPTRITRDFLEDLRANFIAEFRKRNIRRIELERLPAIASPGDFRRALKASLDECALKEIQIVLALDEVESLIGDADALESGTRAVVPELLGMLRSLVQETDEFNVVISGITSAVTERDELYGRENPMFSWAKSIYVPPMSKPEIDTLTTEVGSRMAVTWRSEAIDAMYQQSGGHVFLHRTLATEIVQGLPQDLSRRFVTSTDVQNAVFPWRRSIGERLRTMWRSAKRHYPTECNLLAVVSADVNDLAELCPLYPAETFRLEQLDLLRRGEDGALSLAPLTLQLRHVGVI